jgi:hypothetical protein
MSQKNQFYKEDVPDSTMKFNLIWKYISKVKIRLIN